MDLAIDVGNTLTKFGLGEGGEILSSYEFQTEPSRRRDEIRSRILGFLDGKKPGKAILSSVVPSLLGEYKEALQGISGRLIVLGPGLKTGLVLHVENPREVGSDLVAGAYAAKSLFGKNLFIADFGTATKYIYLDQEARFAGLSIAPGLEISAKALSKDASALPEVPLEIPPSPVGRNTVHCMQSGILYGRAYECLGFLDSFSKEAGVALRPILTGGNARHILPLLPGFEHEENLVLKGLLLIGEGFSL